MRITLDTATDNKTAAILTVITIMAFYEIDPSNMEGDESMLAGDPLPPQIDAAAAFGHNSVPAGTPAAPPPPPASIAPTSENTEVIGGALFDKKGTAHDPAIHSAKPTLNTDGTWRARRGLKPEVLVQPAPAPAPAPTPPPVPPAPPPAPPAPAFQSSVTPPVPQPVPPVVPPGVLPGAPANLTFKDLMMRVNSAVSGGRLTNEQALAMAKQNGCTTGFQDVIGNTALLARVYQAFGAV